MEVEQEAPGFRLPGDRGVLSFRLLAVDLDGTLLDASGNVHAADLETIEELARRGVPTTIITGRLYSGTRHVAAAVGASGAVACVDGSHLVDVASGEDLLHGGLMGEDADRLRAILARHHEAGAFLFANDQILYDEGGDAYAPYVRTWSIDHVRTERLVDHPHWSLTRGITALVCAGPRRAIEPLRCSVEEELGTAVFSVAFPVRGYDPDGVWGMVVRAAGYSKGTALRWLAQHYGVGPEEVVAVGDWYNDVPMFEAAGRSFAMKQAPDDVKRAATDVLSADASTGGGVAEAARRAGML